LSKRSREVEGISYISLHFNKLIGYLDSKEGKKVFFVPKLLFSADSLWRDSFILILWDRANEKNTYFSSL
jgi:hypothetical protein